MQMTTALNLVVAIWTILGVLFIAVAEYRKQPSVLN
jgi:hypothetical protein